MKKENKISSNLLEVLNNIEQCGNYIASEIIYTFTNKNFKTIKSVSESKDGYFVITRNDGLVENIKVTTFLKKFVTEFYLEDDMEQFINLYKRMNNKETLISENHELINIENIGNDFSDVRNTFLSLTTKTYPYGSEYKLVDKLPKGLKKDDFGNYYINIGKSSTMFTSHLDTFSVDEVDVRLCQRTDLRDDIIYSDGTTIIGADDKAGVALMCYMIENNVNGLYYFFIGEEKGSIGAKNLKKEFNNIEYLKNIKSCVSFDRRGEKSIITMQNGVECCSLDFANGLKEEFGKSDIGLQLDPTGVSTDSAIFTDIISECTNISVGYYNEHTYNEHINMDYLIKLSKSCLRVDWENLPIERNV